MNALIAQRRANKHRSWAVISPNRAKFGVATHSAGAKLQNSTS